MLRLNKRYIIILLLLPFFDGFRFGGVPFYDIFALFLFFLVVKMQLPRVTVADPLVVFLLSCIVNCIYWSAYTEALNYVSAWVFYYFGVQAKRYNMSMTHFIYVMLCITIILAFMNLKIPEFAFGPISFRGSFYGENSRFSLFFTDPNKLAAYFYMPFVVYICTNPKLLISMLILVKTRFGLAYVLLNYVSTWLGMKLSKIFLLLFSVIFILFYNYIDYYILDITKMFRPEFENRTSSDGIRLMSFLLMIDLYIFNGVTEVFGPGNINQYYFGTSHPHNTFVGVWLEGGRILGWVFVLSCFMKYHLVSRDMQVPFLFLLLIFLIFDAQSYRLLYFYIGFISVRETSSHLFRKRVLI